MKSDCRKYYLCREDESREAHQGTDHGARERAVKLARLQYAKPARFPVSNSIKGGAPVPYATNAKTLTEAKIIADSTYIWWALRPSLRYPTLELRITDCCTAVDDAVAIAGLYRALVRHVVEHPKLNAQFSAVARALTEENRWRAQRYGTTGTYVDVATREAKPFRQMLDETLDLVSPNLTALGLDSEVAHLRRIAANGTSAHRQLVFYRDLRKAGMPRVGALKEVSRWLRNSTEVGSFVDNQPRADAA